MFGKDFLFGVSMSGFQFEMGGEDSTDPNSDWFMWVRDGVNIASGLVSGDLPEDGVDYWNKFKGDHDLMREFGIGAVRIGIEWSRIFPSSTKGVEVEVERDGSAIKSVKITKEDLKELEKLANMEAVERYKEIMKDIKGKGMWLMVNLNHFTLPLWIHDPVKVRKFGVENVEKSGWYSEDTVVEFAKFSAFCAQEFGNLVDAWSTMNEPQVVSSLGYILINAGFPPSYPSFEAYIKATINLAQAHARAYDSIKSISDKEVGIIYSFSPAYPVDGKDGEHVDMANYYQNFWFMDMITSGRIGKLFEGFPELERSDMKDKVDFLGVNYYTRMVVDKGGPMGWRVLGGYGYGCEPYSRSKSGYPASQVGWEIYPKGLYDIIRMLHERYELDMIVTENGTADPEDKLRPYYLISHIYEVERALSEGYPVLGYLHWSFMDNYEWSKGFDKRFGLVQVDLESKSRNPRPSAYIYSEIIKKRTTKGMVESVPYEI